MRTFKDTRGKSWFDIVPEMDGQIDITISYPGTIRAFHCHEIKTEWMFVVAGEFKFVLTDPAETLYLSQGDSVKIVPGRWHGYQALSNKLGIIMEVATHKHDLESPDDKRKPYQAFDTWEIECK